MLKSEDSVANEKYFCDVENIRPRYTILLYASVHCIAHIFDVTHIRERNTVSRITSKNGCPLL